MKKIKISKIFANDNFEYLLIPRILESYFDVKLEWTSPAKCELLIIGSYKKYEKFFRLFYTLINSNLKSIFDEFRKGLLFSKNKPVTILYLTEDERPFLTVADFRIGSDYNYSNNEKYIRIPVWKEYIDWSNLKLKKIPIDCLNAKRFGMHYDINELIKPQGLDLLSKQKKICSFFSHLNPPRKELINLINNVFEVSGFGVAFDKRIPDHNNSNFFKKDILNNYFANFCPENSIFPGWYTEKVLDSFLGKSLPITWADQNISKEFNSNSFINLNNYSVQDILDVLQNLKSEDFLLNFTKEPILLEKPNLNKEIEFTKKIIKNFL
jgi:hypothetical protein